MTEVYVTGVNLACDGGVALLSDGQIVPITNYGDDDGDACERNDPFTWFICGPSVQGWWFTERIEDFKWKAYLDS